MRIAHFAETFSPLSETFIYDGVKELERQGLDNHVVTLNRVNAEERPFGKTHVVEKPSWGHPRRLWHRALAEIGIGRYGKEERDWTGWPVLRTRMKNILRQISPDVVHAQFGPAGVIIAPVATALDVPLVVTLHGYDVTELLRETRWQKAYRSLGDQAAQLLGVSSHICERMVDVGMPEQKVKKFFLGVKLDDFEYQARNSNAKSSSVHCLHVGRLTEKKGPALLLEALHHARKRLDESITLHLSIAGDGQLFDLVESRISELELDETVEMLGAVPHERVVALMRKADLYTQHCVTASSGDQEGLPVSLMEAAAVGLPIVSTRHSGIPDLVTHEETGLLVEERDTEAMGRYIAALARDPERRSAMGRAGRQRVEERFDLKKKIQKLTGVYEDVLSKKTP